jgi:hypothetical protein
LKIPGTESLVDYRAVKNLPNFDRKVERVSGFALVQARHDKEFRSKFILPSRIRNIDNSNMVYLDKGNYTEITPDTYEISNQLENIEDFKLYFKALGVGDKDKEKFLGDD